MLFNTPPPQSSLKCPHQRRGSSRTTSAGRERLRASVCVLSLCLICLSQSPPSPVHTFTFPRMTDHPVRPSACCPPPHFIATCHLSLSPLRPHVSLSLGPPKRRCVGPVRLADGHSVTQREAILPRREAIVVGNIMDREVQRHY